MKTYAKTSILIPIALLAVLVTANVGATPRNDYSTATPIQHLVVIYDENVSFDHYFGTYPNATNPANEPQFNAAPGTPTADGLTGPLLTDNPNYLVTGNPSDNPQLLGRTQPVTCDNNHDYTAEQQAFNNGLMNMFPEQTSCSNGLVMDYYDGNTVTALWNYAQNFALSDNSFGTTFGPSTPGALNVVAGIGGPAQVTYAVNGTTTSNLPGVLANGQLIGDIDPTYDDCSYTQDNSATTAAMAPASGAGAPQNIGDLLNTAGVTWGWFEGGFTPTVPYNATTGALSVCGSSNAQVGGSIESSYSPHHEPFQYFLSTANPHHLPPSSTSMIGYTDQANHQYDLSSFWAAADSGNLPAVSYLKAPRYQDGHPGNSDPLDEQAWLVNTINQLMSLPTWSSTAIIINWDDSDGWYDQIMPPIVNPSNDPANDALNGNSCGQGAPPLGVQDRCGYGPRIPLLVISPYAKSNFIDNTLTDQTSVVSFIEYNWHLGNLGPESYDHLSGSLLNMFDFSQPQQNDGVVILNPSTGEVVQRGQNSLVSSNLFGLPDTVSLAAPSSDNGNANGNGGVPNLNTAKTCTDVDTNPDVCATSNGIVRASITPWSDVWFSASAYITPRESSTPLTVHYTGQWINVQLKGGSGLPLQIPAPNSEIVFSATATTVTTTFTGDEWVTTVPLGFQGNVFIGGVAYQLPAGVSLSGAKADWTGVFSGTTNSFTLSWQWAAAVYSTMGASIGSASFYNGLGVKPTAAVTGSLYLNNDNAGTPENFKADYVSSATTGFGQSDSGHFNSDRYTGAYNAPGDAYYQAYLLNM